MAIEIVDRHVQDVDEEHVPLDRRGFLDLGAGAGITLVDDLIGMPQSFVLLAAGGAGKSVVLDELCEREGGVAVDLILFNKGELGRVISEAVASGRPVYMDSLDEVLAADPSLAGVLTRVMSKSEGRSVRWRLACRPSAWTSAFAEAVDGIKKFRLLPLTHNSARRLLASLDIGEEFLDAVAASGESRLNGSLLHFIAAAGQWKRDGRLPHRRADALEREVQRLLAEREDVREPLRTAADVRRRAAGRLAAFSIFGGIGGYAFRTSANPSTFAAAELPSQPEPDRPDVTVGREVYEEVLGSALFDSAPNDTVFFRHQEYADYLAARYVVDRGPVRAQVKALLGMTGGVVPSSMASVAAWTVALDPDLADTVASGNAVALVQSEVDLPATARASVVAALLADARAAEAGPMWALDLSVVVHSGLEGQLTDHVVAGVEYAGEVWWICRLALAGRTTALASAALAMALDGRWPSWARRPAIAVVADLGTDAQRLALLSGLALDEEADPDDELRAGLLEGLYPQHMTTAQLLPFVIQPRRRVFFGAYRRFLMEFAGRIPVADLPVVLGWARENHQSHISFESRDWADDVGFRVVARALASSDSPTVLEPLVDLVVVLLGRTRRDVPWAHDDARRRRLALAVAARLEDKGWTLLVRSRLVIATDVDWLTEVVDAGTARGTSALARCLAHLLAQAAQVLAPRDADEDEEEGADEIGRGPDRAGLAAAIMGARRDLAVWPALPIALAQGGTDEFLFACDLTDRPGWSLLDAREQEAVLDLGLQFVIQHSPTPGMWLGKTSVGLEVVRDWGGVYLMTTLARHAPERLADVPAAAWLRWAPAVANAFTFDDKLVTDLVELSPPEAEAEILAAVRAALDARNEWQPKPLYEYFAKDLARDLAMKVRQRRYPDDQNAQLLVFLIKHSPGVAMDTCRAVATDDGTALSREANRHLAAVDASGTIDRLLDDPVSQDALLERIRGVVLEPRPGQPAPAQRVDDGRLAAFAGLLFDRLPFASDPPRTDGWSSSWERDGTGLRNYSVEVLAGRGLVRELDVLAQGRAPAEQTFIRHHLRRARQVAADNGHVHLAPSDVLALLSRSDIRLIRNAQDAVNVVEDHLDELQHDLSRNGSFRDLWSPDGTTLGSEDDITDWIRRRLTDRLGKDRVTLGRESQVERLKVRGLGSRIDLNMSAPTLTAPAGTANVIIEAKLVTNKELLTALRDQLVQRYLDATGQRYGVYLVYWVPPEQRPPWAPKIHADKDELLERIRALSAQVAPRYDVRPYVLDVSWPSSKDR